MTELNLHYLWEGIVLLDWKYVSSTSSQAPFSVFVFFPKQIQKQNNSFYAPTYRFSIFFAYFFLFSFSTALISSFNPSFHLQVLFQAYSPFFFPMSLRYALKWRLPLRLHLFSVTSFLFQRHFTSGDFVEKLSFGRLRAESSFCANCLRPVWRREACQYDKAENRRLWWP